MAKIEVSIRKVIDDIGPSEIMKELRTREFNDFFGNLDPTELGDLLRATMSPEALAELREALK
jgi:hypothetical protein